MTSPMLNFETLCNNADNSGAREAIKSALQLFANEFENMIHSNESIRILKSVLAGSNISKVDWQSYNTPEENNSWCWSECLITFNDGREVTATNLDLSEIKCEVASDEEWLKNFLSDEHFKDLPAFGYESKIEVYPHSIRVIPGEMDCGSYSNYFFRLVNMFMNK